MMFGYAKPVPVDFGRLRQKAQAGTCSGSPPPAWPTWPWPLLGGAGQARLAAAGQCLHHVPMTEMGKIGILVNCVLMVLNLIPLPPSMAADHRQPAAGRLAWKFPGSSPGAFRSLLLLLFTGILGAVMPP